jgi:hypothetical protein
MDLRNCSTRFLHDEVHWHISNDINLLLELSASFEMSQEVSSTVLRWVSSCGKFPAAKTLPCDSKTTGTSPHYANFSVHRMTLQNVSDRLALPQSLQLAVLELRKWAPSTLRPTQFWSDDASYHKNNNTNVKNSPKPSLEMFFAVYSVLFRREIRLGNSLKCGYAPRFRNNGRHSTSAMVSNTENGLSEYSSTSPNVPNTLSRRLSSRENLRLSRTSEQIPAQRVGLWWRWRRRPYSLDASLFGNIAITQ